MDSVRPNSTSATHPFQQLDRTLPILSSSQHEPESGQQTGTSPSIAQKTTEVHPNDRTWVDHPPSSNIDPIHRAHAVVFNQKNIETRRKALPSRRADYRITIELSVYDWRPCQARVALRKAHSTEVEAWFFEVTLCTTAMTLRIAAGRHSV